MKMTKITSNYVAQRQNLGTPSTAVDEDEDEDEDEVEEAINSTI